MNRWITKLGTHTVAVGIGFALGVYFLPILTAPPSPDTAMLEAQAEGAEFTATLTRDLRGSDFLHWGEGSISITPTQIIHMGALAPGPDYMVYLTTEFAEHEDEFEPLKADAALIGPVKTFQGFLLDIPAGIDPAAYTTVVVWCEAFGEFITAAQYR